MGTIKIGILIKWIRPLRFLKPVRFGMYKKHCKNEEI